MAKLVYPKKGICPICKKQLKLDKNERIGKKFVDCPSCQSKYQIKKMIFNKYDEIKAQGRTPQSKTEEQSLTSLEQLIVLGISFVVPFVGVILVLVFLVQKYRQSDWLAVLVVSILGFFLWGGFVISGTALFL